ncbi:hypothetical protein HK414_15890 [Ramlibacter terrae]|uniref:Uncharacterized protein n=1 Tax=Ramlibacter terrae TaxID=2732511 RepID=A0ABX6P3J9_9BURK|nr:hypothetical protein HK414_15890 [Ramlibacter terrae]
MITVAPGDLTLTANTGMVDAGGVALLQAAGAITANASVTAGSHLSVLGASLTQAAAGDFVSEGGSIDVQATSGAITMADGAMAQSSGGNIRYAASGAITVGLLDARSTGARGSVSIVSGAAITDNAETSVDVYANVLRLNAVSGIATGSEQLETQATLLSADGGTGGVYLSETNALEIGATGDISVNRVGIDSQTDATGDLSQQGRGRRQHRRHGGGGQPDPRRDDRHGGSRRRGAAAGSGRLRGERLGRSRHT